MHDCARYGVSGGRSTQRSISAIYQLPAQFELGAVTRTPYIAKQGRTLSFASILDRELNMKSLILTLVAASSLIASATSFAGESAPLTRAEVRAELADARADGRVGVVDRYDHIGPSVVQSESASRESIANSDKKIDRSGFGGVRSHNESGTAVRHPAPFEQVFFGH